MIKDEKIKFYSCGGFLVLRIEWYGQHGVCYFCESSNAAFVESQAANEQAAISKGKSIPFKFSWRERWEQLRADYNENYHAFNLSKSSVVAYVSVCDITLEMYNNPKVLARLEVEVLTKKHLAKYLLTHWIEKEGIKVNFNE